MVYDDDEIKRLLKEERARGKRQRQPLSETVIRRKLEQMRVVDDLLAERNFVRFLHRLNEAGLETDSDGYKLAVGAWLDHWRGRQ